MTFRRTAAALVAATLASPLLLAPPASAAPRVSWTDTTVEVGDRVRATVATSSRPKGTELILQRRYPEAWRAADGSADRTRRGFVLDVPSDQMGTFRYRVVARDGKRTVAASDARTVRVRPSYDPVGRARDHSLTRGGDGRKILWDSCAGPIEWTFNPRNAPTRALGQLREGFKRIHQATGLVFDYVGTTDQKPTAFGQGIRNGADIILGWRTARDYDTFAENPQVVGEGGNSHRYGFRDGTGAPTSMATSGGVVFNADQDRSLANGYGRGYTWGEVIIHEIGHVLGLSHTEGNSQVMYFQTIRRNAQWGAGDLAGLRKVGDTRGCLTQASGRAFATGHGTTAHVTRR